MLNHDDLGGMLTTSENLTGVLHDKSSIVKGVLNQNEDLRGIIDEENTLTGSLVVSNSLSGILGAPLGEYSTDYNDLTNKPQINGVTLQGDKSTSDLGLFSGNYNDLTNKPTIPAAQVNSDWNANSGVEQILNKPTLATVATTGDYDDLANKPTIPAAQVNSDWDAVAGIAKILNKPSLAPVATTGDYDDLTNKPSIPAAQVNSDWNANSGVAEILNKPSLATVATTGSYNNLANKPALNNVIISGHKTSSDYGLFSGDYNDLTNKPTIPAAQVNSDWNANSGVAQILNKPTLATVATTGSYNDLLDKPTIGGLIPYRDVETQIGTWLDGTTPVYQKYIRFNSTITLAPNTNVNLAPLPGDILLLGGGCIRIDSSYTGYFPYIQLVANGTYLQGNNIRNTSVGINAVLIQYVYRS